MEPIKKITTIGEYAAHIHIKTAILMLVRSLNPLTGSQKKSFVESVCPDMNRLLLKRRTCVESAAPKDDYPRWPPISGHRDISLITPSATTHDFHVISLGWAEPPSIGTIFYQYCVTQLMLYTGDKLSNPIFWCLSVSHSVRHRCHPTKSLLFPIYKGIRALCWPFTI